MIRTQIQLNVAQIRRLKHLATQRGVSMAELIRQSVDLFVRTTVIVDDVEQRRRALQASGRFHSGCPNIAATHDDYLEEAFGS